MNYIENLINILNSYMSIEKVYLYGSRNLGNCKEDSDYDICIIINSANEKEIIVAALGNYMISNNIIIHPLIMTVDEYLEKADYPVYKKEIFADGTILIDKKV